jgi:hypothetical protein
MFGKTITLVATLTVVILTSACAKLQEAQSQADVAESGQSIADVMSSIDEASGSTNGQFAFSERAFQKALARLSPEQKSDWIWSQILPRSNALSCTSSTFSGCSSGVVTRTYSGCMIGSATFSGTVTLNYSQSTCGMGSVGYYVTRNPSLTVTGLRGATLTVSKSGTYGQKVAVTASNTLQFSNDGINRKFSLSGVTLFDFTTTTTSPITVTGTASRSGRVINGGTLHVVNNVTGVSCDYSPSNVTYSGTSCNCPSSGAWSGSCTDGKTASLTITSCGTGVLKMGTQLTNLAFDSCD